MTPKYPTVEVTVTAADSVYAIIGRVARALPTDDAAGEWTAAAWATRPAEETRDGAAAALLQTAAGFVTIRQV